MSEAGAPGGSAPDGTIGRGPWVTAAQLGGLASLGAGAIHAAAAGVHAEHVTLSRLFVVTAVAQLVVGLVLLVRAGRLPPPPPSSSTASPPAPGSSPARRASRGSPASRPPRTRASPTPSAPLLGVLAVGGALAVLLRGTATAPARTLPRRARRRHRRHHRRRDDDRRHPRPQPRRGRRPRAHRRRRHDRGHRPRAHRRRMRRRGRTDATPPTSTATETATADAATWPRPWDPAATIDFSGVPGVTAEQQDRAEALAASTIAELPVFADVTAVAGARASSRSATPAPASSTTSTRRSSSTTTSSTRATRSRSSTASTGTSARSSRRCSSPRTSPSTTPSSSTGAAP